MLFAELPEDSRTTTWAIDRGRDLPRPARKKGEPLPTSRWGQIEHLLADIRDLMARQNYVTVAAAATGKEESIGKPPKPFPRPTDLRPAGLAAQAQAQFAQLEQWASQRLADRKKEPDDA